MIATSPRMAGKDGDPDSLGAVQTDAYMGAVARGTTVSGRADRTFPSTPRQ